MKFYLSLLFFTITVLLLPGFIKATLLNPTAAKDFLHPSFLDKRGMGLRLPHLLRLQDSGSFHHEMDKRRLGVRLPNLVRMRRLQDSSNANNLFQFQK